MFAFIVIETISKRFVFSNIRSLIIHFTFEKLQYYFRVTIKGPLWILKVSVVKVVAVLIELQIKQVFFTQGSHLPASLVLGSL